MALTRKNKELAAIGASIGAFCRPCIDQQHAVETTAGKAAACLEAAGAKPAAAS